MTIHVIEATGAPANLLAGVSNPIITPPLNAIGRPPLPYAQGYQSSRIRQFLFQVRKDSFHYWVGAAVPENTADFTRAQVYFHPETHRPHEWVATDADYVRFTGGWIAPPARAVFRYVGIMGGQLAAARPMPLIVPFTTMAAVGGRAPDCMFATLPIETLNAIAIAIRAAAIPGATSPLTLARIGVSSFSSGVHAMRTFIHQFARSGLIVEVNDFDSPFIRGEPRALPAAGGAIGRMFSQVAPPSPMMGWTYMAPNRFEQIRAYSTAGVHGQLGMMSFFGAMLTTIV